MSELTDRLDRFARGGRLWARWFFDPVLGAGEGMLLEWMRGRFIRVEHAVRPPADFKEDEKHEALVTPGLLNAHSHLNYSTPAELPRGKFTQWLEAIVALKRKTQTGQSEAEQKKNAKTALLQIIKDGVTEVWDIASFSAGREAMIEAEIPGISFFELIAPTQDNFERRWEEWKQRYETFNREYPCELPLREGISPHASYTVAPRFLYRISEILRRKEVPIAMHLAESPDEIELLRIGRVPLRELLRKIGPNYIADNPPGIGAIMLARITGLFGPNFLAIHANLPQKDETGILAKTRTAVVFCPRSHAWFNYPEYPLEQYRAAGVRLALGTDSLASNDCLSIRAELRQMLEHWPAAKKWTGRELLGLATGALLGDEPPYGGRGRLATGYPAQWVLWNVSNAGELTSEEGAFAQLLDAPLLRSSAFNPSSPAS